MNSALSGIGLSDDKQLPQLRISARVQNKQKRDEVSLSTVSSDGFRKISSNSQDEDEEEEKDSGVSAQVVIKSFKRNTKKRRRTWELWSPEDKKAFFEALNECGKDFESIQSLICKLRKKESQSCIIKNKDQVRHFYYRTWHKISKHVKFNCDVQKATQELYALINYGELRKKVGGTLDEKKGQKLQELIQHGSTSVRVKGKCIRIKTPICRTLKKLNGVEEERDHCAIPILPMSIQVEITPKNMQTWNHVQSLSHNPRVKVLCSMDKPVTSIISYLQQRWKCSRSKIKENLVSSAQFPIDVVPQPQLFLRLTPSSNAIIKRVHVKPDSQVKSYAVSFLNHAQLLKKKGEFKNSGKKERSRKNSSSMKSPPLVNERRDNASDENEDKDEGMGGEMSQEETEGSDADFEDEHEPSCSEQKLNIKEKSAYLSYSEDEDDEEMQMLTPCSLTKIKVEKEESDDAINQLLALESVANFDQPQDDEVICLGENSKLLAQVKDVPPPKPDDESTMEDCETASLSHDEEDKNENILKLFGDALYQKESYDEYVKRVRKGWTANSSSAITVGQVFLMFGCNQILAIEYNFEETEEMDVDINVAAADLDMECSPLKESNSNQFLSNNSKEKSDSDHQTCSKSEDNSEDTDVLDMSDEITSRVFNGCRVLGGGNVPSAMANPSVSVLESGSAISNALKSPPPTALSGLPLPDIIDSSQSSPKQDIEDDVKKSDSGDFSRMMNRLFGLMKSLSSPQDSCFCRLSSLARTPRTPTGSLRSPIGTRCGSNFGRSPGSTKSPRGVTSTLLSPRTPTPVFPRSPGLEISAPTQRLPKPKPPSAKRLLTDIPEKIPSNIIDSSLIRTDFDDDKVKLESDLEMNSFSTSFSTSYSTSFSTSFSTSKTNVRISTTGGEFRVPIAPAPRTICQAPSTNFNAQLSKLIPRYSMPSRRATRKNMVVQRQLPLLPRTPVPFPGYVTLTVLPPHNQLEGFNYKQEGQKLTPLAMKIPAASTNATDGFSDKIEPLSNLGTGSNSSSSERTMQPLLVQELSVPTNLIPTSNVSQYDVTSVAIANAISVNVSGHQLLTVEMPNVPKNVFTTLNDLINKPSIQFSSAVSSSPSITTIASSGTSVTFTTAATTTIPTTFAFVNPENSASVGSNVSVSLSENSDSLSSFLTETLGGPITYLSDPLCSTKDLVTPSDFKGVFSSSAGSISALNFECSSDLLIGKSSSNQVSSTPSLLAPCENSLLNTPIRLLPCDSAPHKNVDAVRLNISSLLDSPDTSLNESDEQIPQIHIPDCNTSLPLFDISIGGTISVCETIKDHVTDILSSESPESEIFQGNLKNNELTLSVTCVTSSVVTSEAAITKPIIDDLSLQAFQDTSCDKIMDITLASSNSNSCFSSLLAATSGPPPALDSLLENSLLQTPPRPSLRVGGINLEVERFESLSAVPPSPPSSPSRLLHQNDSQWLHHDANEFSLSSLLGSMESPCKSGSSVTPSGEGTLSQSLISALNDNTVDFTSTFARLKNQTKDHHF